MGHMNQNSNDTVIINFEEGMRLYRFNELKEYLEVTENYLTKAKRDFEKSADEQEKQLISANPHLTQDDISQILADDYWHYSERFPRILRNSFFISIISLLEFEMTNKCKRIKTKPGQITLSEIKGSTLEQIKRYIENAGHKFPSNMKWQEIGKYYLVRNCIAHNNGFIKGTKKESILLKYLKSKNIISEDTIEEEIALTPVFIKEVIEIMEAFLVDLDISIQHIN